MIKKAIKKTKPARYQAPDGSLLLATLGPLTDSILCFRIIIATGYPITLATNTGVYWGLSGPIQTLPTQPRRSSILGRSGTVGVAG